MFALLCVWGGEQQCLRMFLAESLISQESKKKALFSKLNQGEAPPSVAVSLSRIIHPKEIYFYIGLSQ